MGISLSKRVTNTLNNSPVFNSTCNSTFDHFLSISGGSHIHPYQLFDAATHLHASLLHSLTLITRWAPSSPSRAQVDHAYRVQAQEAQSQAQNVQVQAQKAHAQEGLARAQKSLTQAQETHVSEDLAHAQEGQTQESMAEESLDQAQKGLSQAQEGLAQSQAQEAFGRDEFKEFALVLLSDMIVSGAKAKVVGMVPIGVVGIGGAVLISRVDKNLVGSAIGVYTLGVATWIYVGLA